MYGVVSSEVAFSIRVLKSVYQGVPSRQNIIVQCIAKIENERLCKRK